LLPIERIIIASLFFINYYIVINTVKEVKISASSALTAKTFENYLLTYHRKLSVQLLRDSYVVILPAGKVDYVVAPDASEMMMGLHIRIIPLRLPVPFNNTCNTDFRECHG